MVSPITPPPTNVHTVTRELKPTHIFILYGILLSTLYKTVFYLQYSFRFTASKAKVEFTRCSRPTRGVARGLLQGGGTLHRCRNLKATSPTAELHSDCPAHGGRALSGVGGGADFLSPRTSNSDSVSPEYDPIRQMCTHPPTSVFSFKSPGSAGPESRFPANSPSASKCQIILCGPGGLYVPGSKGFPEAARAGSRSPRCTRRPTSRRRRWRGRGPPGRPSMTRREGGRKGVTPAPPHQPSSTAAWEG